MATMGIVSLPGMMTGQILGGSGPMSAIRYQMAVMVAILVAVTLGTYLNLKLTMRTAFTDRDMLDRSVLRGKV
jgi:putative ABC transport system permease protein